MLRVFATAMAFGAAAAAAAAQVDGGDGMVGGAVAGATGTSAEQVRPADY